MAKDKPHWLDHVLTAGEFCGCQRGMIAMTRDPDTDLHTLWIFKTPTMLDQPRKAVRDAYNALSIDGFNCVE